MGPSVVVGSLSVFVGPVGGCGPVSGCGLPVGVCGPCRWLWANCRWLVVGASIVTLVSHTTTWHHHHRPRILW